MKKIVKTDEEWQKILTEEEFWVTRRGGTEKPFYGNQCENSIIFSKFWEFHSIVSVQWKSM